MYFQLWQGVNISCILYFYYMYEIIVYFECVLDVVYTTNIAFY